MGKANEELQAELDRLKSLVIERNY